MLPASPLENLFIFCKRKSHSSCFSSYFVGGLGEGVGWGLYIHLYGIKRVKGQHFVFQGWP